MLLRPANLRDTVLKKHGLCIDGCALSLQKGERFPDLLTVDPLLLKALMGLVGHSFGEVVI